MIAIVSILALYVSVKYVFIEYTLHLAAGFRCMGKISPPWIYSLSFKKKIVMGHNLIVSNFAVFRVRKWKQICLRFFKGAW